MSVCIIPKDYYVQKKEVDKDKKLKRKKSMTLEDHIELYGEKKW